MLINFCLSLTTFSSRSLTLYDSYNVELHNNTRQTVGGEERGGGLKLDQNKHLALSVPACVPVHTCVMSTNLYKREPFILWCGELCVVPSLAAWQQTPAHSLVMKDLSHFLTDLCFFVNYIG